MADFKTPNLCGANESLNTALSKIDDIKAEIESKLNSSASEAAAAFETAQADIKAGLDALAVDLPEAKPVNLQSEITSLINDIDKTTAEGIASFNAKVAELKKDFGGALGDKGLDLDKLIDEGTTKLGKDISAATDFLTGTGEGSLTGELTSAFGLSGESVNLSSGGGIAGVSGNISEYIAPTTTATGGNLCDLIPNLEIPADVAGTGVTTKEIEDRVSNATTLTLSETPKEILSVQGKKTTQSFFTNIQYKQNGKIIVPSATGTYDTIKATYTVDLIKEKPIAAKQADVPAETEEVSIVTTNTSAKDTSFEGLIAKFRKDIESASSNKDISKDIANINTALASIGSPEFKAKQEKDFATWQTEYKKLKADPLNYKPVVTKTGESVKATTIETAITKETKTDKDGFTYTETKRVTSSDAGLTHRTKDNFIDLVKIDTAKEVLDGLDSTKYPDWYETIQEVIEFYDPATNIAEIDLNPYNQPILNITSFEYVSILRKGLVDPVTRVVQPSGIVEEELETISNKTRQSTTYYRYALGNKLKFENIAGLLLDPFTDPDIFAITISYKTMDKIDPNYSG
jgi:hypothetical protein